MTKEAIKMSDLVHEFVVSGKPPFEACHASTLLAIDGGFLVCWFAGSEEGKSDVGIWMTKRLDNKWSSPWQLSKVKPEPHWNPVLFRSNETIYLFFKVGKEIETWSTWFIKSDDEGDIWSPPAELIPGDKGGRGPVKNKPIIISDGSWLAPASSENEWWEAFVDISHDNGATWGKSFVPMDRKMFHGCDSPENMPQNHGVIQPTLWESAPGHVHMLLRSSCGYICRSDSDDYGATWCSAYKTELPSNNSGIDLAKASDGTLALIYNHNSENWGLRSPLSLVFSRDNGKNWINRVDVEIADGEFSYPAIISHSDEYVLTYTWNRKNIVFIKGVKNNQTYK